MSRITELRRRIEKRPWTLLPGIVIVALGIRVMFLGQRPFWLDEAVYTLVSEQFVGTIRLAGDYPGFPPLQIHNGLLFLHILSLVRALVGLPTEFQARAVAAVLGALTVVPLYVLGREAFDRRTGMVAAAFLAVWNGHVLYSRQVHSAAPAMFLLTSVLALLFTADRRKDRRIAAAGIALGVVSLVSHAAVPFVLLPFSVILLARAVHERWGGGESRFWRVWAVAVLVLLVGSILAGVLPVLPLELYLESSTDTASSPLVNTDLWSGGAEAAGAPFALLAQGLVLVVSSLWQSFLIADPVAVLGTVAEYALLYTGRPLLYLPALLAVLGVARVAERKGRGGLYVLWWTGTTVFALMTAVMYAATFGLSAIRVGVFLLPPLILLAAAGATWTGRLSRWGLLAAAGIVLMNLAMLPATIPVRDATVQQDLVCGDGDVLCYPYHPVGYDPSVDWRDATREAVMWAGEGETVYSAMGPPVMYYAAGEDIDVRGLECNAAQIGSSPRACNFTRILRTERPFWVVNGGPGRATAVFSSRQRRILETSCAGRPSGGMTIFRCPVEPGR